MLLPFFHSNFDLDFKMSKVSQLNCTTVDVADMVMPFAVDKMLLNVYKVSALS